MEFIDDLGITGSKIPVLEPRLPGEKEVHQQSKWRVPDLLGYGFNVVANADVYPEVGNSGSMGGGSSSSAIAGPLPQGGSNNNNRVSIATATGARGRDGGLSNPNAGLSPYKNGKLEKAEEYFCSNAHEFHLSRCGNMEKVRTNEMGQPSDREISVLAKIHGITYVHPFSINIKEVFSKPVVQIRDDTIFRSQVNKASGDGSSVKNGNQFFTVLDHLDVITQPRNPNHPKSDLERRKPVTCPILDDRGSMLQAIGQRRPLASNPYRRKKYALQVKAEKERLIAGNIIEPGFIRSTLSVKNANSYFNKKKSYGITMSTKECIPVNSSTYGSGPLGSNLSLRKKIKQIQDNGLSTSVGGGGSGITDLKSIMQPKLEDPFYRDYDSDDDENKDLKDGVNLNLDQEDDPFWELKLSVSQSHDSNELYGLNLNSGRKLEAVIFAPVVHCSQEQSGLINTPAGSGDIDVFNIHMLSQCPYYCEGVVLGMKRTIKVSQLSTHPRSPSGKDTIDYFSYLKDSSADAGRDLQGFEKWSQRTQSRLAHDAKRVEAFGSNSNVNQKKHVRSRMHRTFNTKGGGISGGGSGAHQGGNPYKTSGRDDDNNNMNNSNNGNGSPNYNMAAGSSSSNSPAKDRLSQASNMKFGMKNSDDHNIADSATKSAMNDAMMNDPSKSSSGKGWFSNSMGTGSSGIGGRKSQQKLEAKKLGQNSESLSLGKNLKSGSDDDGGQTGQSGQPGGKKMSLDKAMEINNQQNNKSTLSIPSKNEANIGPLASANSSNTMPPSSGGVGGIGQLASVAFANVDDNIDTYDSDEEGNYDQDQSNQNLPPGVAASSDALVDSDAYFSGRQASGSYEVDFFFEDELLSITLELFPGENVPEFTNSAQLMAWLEHWTEQGVLQMSSWWGPIMINVVSTDLALQAVMKRYNVLKSPFYIPNFCQVCGHGRRLLAWNLDLYRLGDLKERDRNEKRRQQENQLKELMSNQNKNSANASLLSQLSNTIVGQQNNNNVTSSNAAAVSLPSIVPPPQRSSGLQTELKSCSLEWNQAAGILDQYTEPLKPGDNKTCISLPPHYRDLVRQECCDHPDHTIIYYCPSFCCFYSCSQHYHQIRQRGFVPYIQKYQKLDLTLGGIQGVGGATASTGLDMMMDPNNTDQLMKKKMSSMSGFGNPGGDFPLYTNDLFNPNIAVQRINANYKRIPIAVIATLKLKPKKKGPESEEKPELLRKVSSLLVRQSLQMTALSEDTLAKTLQSLGSRGSVSGVPAHLQFLQTTDGKGNAVGGGPQASQQTGGVLARDKDGGAVPLGSGGHAPAVPASPNPESLLTGDSNMDRALNLATNSSNIHVRANSGGLGPNEEFDPDLRQILVSLSTALPVDGRFIRIATKRGLKRSDLLFFVFSPLAHRSLFGDDDGDIASKNFFFHDLLYTLKNLHGKMLKHEGEFDTAKVHILEAKLDLTGIVGSSSYISQLHPGNGPDGSQTSQPDHNINGSNKFQSMTNQKPGSESNNNVNNQTQSGKSLKSSDTIGLSNKSNVSASMPMGSLRKNNQKDSNSSLLNQKTGSMSQSEFCNVNVSLKGTSEVVNGHQSSGSSSNLNSNISMHGPGSGNTGNTSSNTNSKSNTPDTNSFNTGVVQPSPGQITNLLEKLLEAKIPCPAGCGELIDRYRPQVSHTRQRCRVQIEKNMRDAAKLEDQERERKIKEEKDNKLPRGSGLYINTPNKNSGGTGMGGTAVTQLLQGITLNQGSSANKTTTAQPTQPGNTAAAAPGPTSTSLNKFINANNNINDSETATSESGATTEGGNTSGGGAGIGGGNEGNRRTRGSLGAESDAGFFSNTSD